MVEEESERKGGKKGWGKGSRREEGGAEGREAWKGSEWGWSEGEEKKAGGRRRKKEG